MRLRNVKNKEEIMNSSNYLIRDYEGLKGNWKSLFKNDNPIYIEIGMGKGKFIIDNAKMYPDINFIGIEKYDSVLVRAVQKLNEKGIFPKIQHEHFPEKRRTHSFFSIEVVEEIE